MNPSEELSHSITEDGWLRVGWEYIEKFFFIIQKVAKENGQLLWSNMRFLIPNSCGNGWWVYLLSLE